MSLPNNYLTIEQVIEKLDSGKEFPLNDLVLAQIIDVATDYREEIRAEEKLINRKKAYFKEMEKAILHAMHKAGTEGSPLLVAGGLQSTATISNSIAPTVTDWGLVIEWMKENDGFHLFQKRIAAKAWEEECKLGDKVPGIEEWEVQKIGLRKR